jgi:alpha-L-fucosidase
VSTQKKGRIYLHVLDWPDPMLAIPRLPVPAKKASILGTGAAVAIKEIDGGHLLQLPAAGRDDVDTIVVVETA